MHQVYTKKKRTKKIVVAKFDHSIGANYILLIKCTISSFSTILLFLIRHSVSYSLLRTSWVNHLCLCVCGSSVSFLHHMMMHWIHNCHSISAHVTFYVWQTQHHRPITFRVRKRGMNWKETKRKKLLLKVGQAVRKIRIKMIFVTCNDFVLYIVHRWKRDFFPCQIQKRLRPSC